MSQFLSDGARLAFDDIRPPAPERATVVLVHGFATNAQENWRRLGWYDAVQRSGRRAVALDLRGHGRSDKSHDPDFYARSAMAGDILALMDHLGVGRADLLGYSMGAHLALGAALSHPARFDNLILGGVGHKTLEGGGPAPNARMTMAEALRAADVAAIDDPTLRGFRRFAEAQGEDLQALAACSEGRGRPLSVGDLVGLTPPTLIIAGDRDEIAGDPARLAEAIPGAKSVALPACDHFTAIPHALFKAAVFDFLEGWLDEM